MKRFRINFWDWFLAPLAVWRQRRPRWWTLFFLGWVALVFFASSLEKQEVPELPGAFPYDKVAHFILYGLGALLLYRLLDSLGEPGRRRYLINTVLTTLLLGGFAVLDEFYQTFVPGRSGLDPGDIFADVSGALCVATATALWLRYRRHRKSSHALGLSTK